MYLKRLFKTVVLKRLSSGERRKKNQLEFKSLKFPDKAQMSRIGGSWSVCSSWSRYTFMCNCHCGLQVSRFSIAGPVTQKSLSRYGRNSGGGCLVLFNFGTVDFAVCKEATSQQALPPALLLGTWRPVQTLSANWQHSIQSEPTSCASWLLSLHLDPVMTFLLLVLPSAELMPGFLSMVIPTTLLLKKTPFQWTTVTQEAFSHHDVTFTSTPVLLCPDSAQPFIMQSRVFKPNNWSYFITIKAKFIP